jgi:hypothetical protein
MNNITDFEIPKTADGKVYLLRSCAADMTGRAGFKWPETGPVEAPTEWWGNESDKPDDLKLGWDPCVECGAGLHGLLWGIGDFSLMKVSAPQNAKWLIVEALASDTAQISRKKAKISRGNVVFCGSLGDAVIRMAALRLTIEGYSAPASTTGYYAPASTTGDYAPASTTGYYAPASTTGDYAPASTTGYCSATPASTTGNYAPASTTGDYAPASTTGYSAPASTTGNYAPASTTGYSAPASTTGNYAPASTTGNYAPASTTGNYAPASTTGENSIAASLGGNMARAGEKGVVIIKWWDAEAQRPRVAVGYVGENGISAGTWYRVESGVLSVVPENTKLVATASGLIWVFGAGVVRVPSQCDYVGEIFR